ncbi:Serpentine Receptor, class H [Caenorhabditis elegans]|uniref:Serpentine Receptor, class H n=1 Tax=Caenorhabditis elegans TaxID=6239 RepID=P91219_CAEEL|nr:Serpentine Receptor, class H [Caenorhabditis elegans]CCD64303.1 Serpentine Receptor, class H [Caenorhabditis elegans]|eukprot:NP_504983.1 Serpentine Receptor, class H [Caenorhabditis elegans]
MNFSCHPDVGYFDSTNFYSLAMHLITIVSTPFYLFGLYCILFKTPEIMKSIKWYLLNLRIWIIIFDYSITIMTIPFILAPFPAGFPLGVLRLFGVPTIIQTLMVLIIFAYMLIAMIAIIESRFNTVCTFSWKRKWKYWRRPWLVANHVIVLLFVIPIGFMVPDQQLARQITFEKLPCLPSEIYNAPVLVLAIDYTYHFIAAVTYITFFTLQVIFFAGFLAWNSISQLMKNTMSRRTFNLQRKFFITLLIQLIVPLVFFFFPSFYVLVSVIIKYYNQAILNILFVGASVQGIVSTWVMLLVYRPYRESVVSLFYKPFKATQENSLKQLNPLRGNGNSIGIVNVV